MDKGYAKKIWVNEEEKLISFHPMEKYYMKKFKSQQEYKEWLIKTAGIGYKWG